MASVARKIDYTRLMYTSSRSYHAASYHNLHRAMILSQQRGEKEVLIYLFFHLNSTNFVAFPDIIARSAHQGRGRDPEPPKVPTTGANIHIYRSGLQTGRREEEVANQAPRGGQQTAGTNRSAATRTARRPASLRTANWVQLESAMRHMSS